MKGFLKGLRYIQQIFEDEQEPEMQIGMPTDVKHVAHIGWDGPTSNAPSWMDQFKSETGPANEMQKNAEVDARDGRPPIAEKRVPLGTESPSESPSRHRSDKARQSRRRNSGGSSLDSPKRSATDSRCLPNSNVSFDSPAQDSPLVAPKSSRRKKSKNSAGESSRKSRSKNTTTSTSTDSLPYSDPGVGGGQESGSGVVLKSKDT